ncbi:Uncharacterised protein [Chryseobacterium nakagawai]|nr:Uncharacterised protein [Chryseobacterium nakagawai]
MQLNTERLVLRDIIIEDKQAFLIIVQMLKPISFKAGFLKR